MDKLTHKTLIEEKKIEAFASQASSNKNDMSVRIIRIRALLTGRFTLAFAFLLLVLGSLVVYQKFYKPFPRVKTITINKQVLQRRSIALAYIQRTLTGNAVDVATGKIVKAARVFNNSIDKIVYLELDLFSAPKGTVIDYIQYKEGRYIAHGEVNISKPNIKNLLFSWNINSILPKLTAGRWTVATYADGLLSKRVSYTIQNGSVTYVYPQEPIFRNDPSYLIKNALSLAKK